MDYRHFNILHICSYYSSKLYTLLLESLEGRNVSSRVFYFGPYGYHFLQGDKPNVDCVPCFTNADRLLFKVKERKAWDRLTEYPLRSYDLIHAHSLFSNGYLALLAKKETGIPYVVAVRNTDVNIFFRRRAYLRNIGVEILSEASRVVFLSPAYMEKVLNQYIPQSMRADIECKSCVIPNGIDELFFSAESERSYPEAYRPTVLQVGRISRLKNQLTTMKACELLIERGLPVTFRVIGPCESSKIARELDSRSFVERVGHTSQASLVEAYRNASVMCLPSFRETFGLSYIESMSQGTPVIYSKDEGIDGYFDEGEIGYSVHPKSVNEVASAIERALLDGKALRDRCLDRSKLFKWGAIADRYIDLYASSADHQIK